MVRLTRDQLDRMRGHARAAYPDECCGLLTGPPPAAGDEGPERLRLFLCRNVQNEMHARDPESFPRTARRAFLIDPFEFERILREAQASGEVLRGIFHSHPDEEAYFSREDRAAAVPFGDRPSFPDAEHIVFSVRGGEVRGAKAFRWDGAREDFVETEVSEAEADGAGAGMVDKEAGA